MTQSSWRRRICCGIGGRNGCNFDGDLVDNTGDGCCVGEAMAQLNGRKLRYLRVTKSAVKDVLSKAPKSGHSPVELKVEVPGTTAGMSSGLLLPCQVYHVYRTLPFSIAQHDDVLRVRLKGFSSPSRECGGCHIEGRASSTVVSMFEATTIVETAETNRTESNSRGAGERADRNGLLMGHPPRGNLGGKKLE